MKDKKEKKYKCFNITKDELNAILAGEEQIRSCSEGSDQEYSDWAEKQIALIRSFYKKVKIQ
ncbi:hypothetical protein [Chryseobacterium indologenes]|uniref:hypothetical protein n=1 Tax=Chryseobacterium indologenes TaxID=253 RepID=UPI001BCACB60|nr:hypothetical protein [Chryseobacterium indologenes]